MKGDKRKIGWSEYSNKADFAIEELAQEYIHTEAD